MVNPASTLSGTKRASRPARESAIKSCMTPIITVAAATPVAPKRTETASTSTCSAAAGPVTCSAAPPKAAARMPPTAPATSPALAGSPDAMASARLSGSATAPTVSADNASATSDFPVKTSRQPPSHVRPMSFHSVVKTSREGPAVSVSR